MKNPYFSYFVIYICLISLVSVFVTVCDKKKAKKGAWRVSELTLIILSAAGGSLAMYLTMLLIRHKTKHVKFMLGIPLIMMFQAAVLLWWNMKMPFFG